MGKIQTDLDLPPAYRTQANYWKSEFFNMQKSCASAHSGAVVYAAAVAFNLQTLNLTILEIKIRKNDVYWKGKIGKDYIGGELNSAIAIMSPVEIGDEVC